METSLIPFTNQLRVKLLIFPFNIFIPSFLLFSFPVGGCLILINLIYSPQFARKTGKTVSAPPKTRDRCTKIHLQQ